MGSFTAFTISLGSPGAMAEQAATAAADGYRLFKLKLTGKARKFFKDGKVRKNGKKKVKKGPKSLRASVKVAGKTVGYTTIKRVGKVK